MCSIAYACMDIVYIDVKMWRLESSILVLHEGFVVKLLQE